MIYDKERNVGTKQNSTMNGKLWVNKYLIKTVSPEFVNCAAETRTS